MTVYRRKPVEVESFFFGVQPQPQWFIDAVQTGEWHDDGSGRMFASFRLKDSKRILKLYDGDAVIQYKRMIWVCERDSFGVLYELPLAPEAEEMTQASPAVAAMVVGTAGTSLCIALGYWLGAGWGWFLVAVLILLMGITGLIAAAVQEDR